MARYQFDNLLLAQGWAHDVIVDVSHAGEIVSVETGDQGSSLAKPSHISGYAIPGIVNCHSHAFQRGFAGLSEFRGCAADSFWTWRELMYQFANVITPDDLASIATYLYIEMLKAGYTRVAEFHYLHHQADGAAFQNPAEMALRIKQAAGESGIGLTLLPVLYMQADFDHSPLSAQQQRFAHTLEAFQVLLEMLSKDLSAAPNMNLGIAFHSLRAVSKESMAEVIDGLYDRKEVLPIHIHIAEQLKEVDACLEHYGARPVEWLMQHFDINSQWCLVHATHMTSSEAKQLAKSKAVVGLCPSTEGNLGDGIFPLQDYMQHSGSFAIGSDSHVSMSPTEELRWLEYGQRLLTHNRNVATDNNHKHCGESLLNKIWRGGATVSKQKLGKIEPGYQADIVVLDEGSAALAATPAEFILDSFVFNGNQNMVRDVMVSGQWCIQNYQHQYEYKAKQGFVDTLKKIRNKL